LLDEKSVSREPAAAQSGGDKGDQQGRKNNLKIKAHVRSRGTNFLGNKTLALELWTSGSKQKSKKRRGVPVVEISRQGEGKLIADKLQRKERYDKGKTGLNDPSDAAQKKKKENTHP